MRRARRLPSRRMEVDPDSGTDGPANVCPALRDPGLEVVGPDHAKLLESDPFPISWSELPAGVAELSATPISTLVRVAAGPLKATKEPS